MLPHQGGDDQGRRKATGKRPTISAANMGEILEGVPPTITTVTSAPCGACKFLRRKCTAGCIFAPYFGSDQGAARFAAVHKVFGASNVSKMLLNIPMNRRHDAVLTISYEAQARLSDPVYGCVSTIIGLQQQVASLQAELAMVQNQLVNNRLAAANVFQTSQQQRTNYFNLNDIDTSNFMVGYEAMQHNQPTYSSNSVTSNNFFLNNIDTTTFGASSYDYVADTSTAPSTHNFQLLQLSTPPSQPVQEEDNEEISHNHSAYANQIMP